MKAAVTEDKGKAVVRDVRKPSPQEGEVLIRILTAGICGGDIRIYKGTFPYLNYPIINGHESCGVIEETGPGVDAGLIGKYVTVDPIRPCGSCYPCRTGKPNCCVNLRLSGVHIDGVFAEYFKTDAERIHLLPDSISPAVASLVEPYCIGLHALNQLKLAEGESILIFGAGPIGLAAADLAKTKNVSVMVVDLFDRRLALARHLDADCVVNSTKKDIETAVMEFTDKEGFPVILEATGVPAVAEAAAKYVANGGRICIAGVTDKPITFSNMLFCNKEVTVVGTRNSNVEFPEVIRLFSEGRLHPSVLVSHYFDLDDYPEAIETAVGNTADTCKIVIRISER